jgi:1-acyl-sn-glycerol-3-phosphate acyltransferase
MRAWLKWYHRMDVVGRANLPAAGPFIVVANHASHLDALCLLAAVPLRDVPRAHPTAGVDYFFATPLRGLLSTLLLGGLPFHRRRGGDPAGDFAGPGAVRQSLDGCRSVLAAGDIVILFPEGSRSVDGVIRPFKRGVGLLVAGTSVPVVPCRLDGTFEAMPKGRLWPRPRRIRLTIGRPVGYADHGRTKASAQMIARQLHAEVVAMGKADRRHRALVESGGGPEVHLAA